MFVSGSAFFVQPTTTSAVSIASAAAAPSSNQPPMPALSPMTLKIASDYGSMNPQELEMSISNESMEIASLLNHLNVKDDDRNAVVFAMIKELFHFAVHPATVKRVTRKERGYPATLAFRKTAENEIEIGFYANSLNKTAGYLGAGTFKKVKEAVRVKVSNPAVTPENPHSELKILTIERAALSRLRKADTYDKCIEEVSQFEATFNWLLFIKNQVTPAYFNFPPEPLKFYTAEKDASNRRSARVEMLEERFKGDLYDFKYGRTNSSNVIAIPTPSERLRVMLNPIKGLGEIHKLGVVHNDVKCANVLVTKEKEGKLNDFDHFRTMKFTKSATSTPCSNWDISSQHGMLTPNSDVFGATLAVADLFNPGIRQTLFEHDKPKALDSLSYDRVFREIVLRKLTTLRPLLSYNAALKNEITRLCSIEMPRNSLVEACFALIDQQLNNPFLGLYHEGLKEFKAELFCTIQSYELLLLEFERQAALFQYLTDEQETLKTTDELMMFYATDKDGNLMYALNTAIARWDFIKTKVALTSAEDLLAKVELMLTVADYIQFSTPSLSPGQSV